MVFTISYCQCQAGCKDTGAAFSGQSDYQKIDVFKSYEFGKMVALDGEIVFRTQMSLYMMRWSHMCRWRSTRMQKGYL